MLTRVDPGPAVVVCSTCRHSREARDDGEGVRGGARLVAAMKRLKAAEPRYAGIAVQDMACLFACQDHITVHLRAPDKIGYVLGRFDGYEDSVRATLDYAVLPAASEDGRIRYEHSPAGVKGYFTDQHPQS